MSSSIKREIQEVDLKAYQPFGIPLLKLMFILASLSLSAAVIYELMI